MPDTTPVIVEYVLNAPIEKVWPALTTKEEMHNWYFEIEAFKPEPGFQFQFSGEGSKGEKYVHHCEIQEVIPMKKISYTWRYDNVPGNSLVSFELTPEGDQTKVTVTHTGIETFDTDSPDFSKESFTKGWTHIVGTSLREWVGR